MKVLKMQGGRPNERYIEMAAEALREGEIVIYPTDTLYGLGCDALNNAAIERICRIKGIKPEKTNLSIICENISEVARYAKLNNAQFRFLKDNLPGPFTFVLPALSKLPKAFKGRKTVGVRIPSNPIATALAAALGNPIMTSSVRVPGSDEDYICEPELIAERFAQEVAYVIDGGRSGIEPSTVVDITGDEPAIIRQGAGELNY